MRPRRPRSWMQWCRRACQAAFLCLFLWFVLSARFRTSETGPGPIRFFFELDPLAVLATLLSTHTLVTGASLALATIILTIVLGRVFCGWVCPLGTVHAIASGFRVKRKRRTEAEQRGPWHRGKYALLAALLLMAAFGVHWVGVFDPISLLYRSVVTAIIPGVQYAVEDGSTAIYQSDPHAGALHLTSATEPAYAFARDEVFRVERQTFLQSTLIAILFIGIVALNFVKPRFWCRYVCPLGGLLGIAARKPLLRLQNDESKCSDCGLCNLSCPAAAQPDQRGKWLPTECFGCWNCVAACRSNAISFTLAPPFRKAAIGTLDLSRRATLAAGVSGFAALLSFRIEPAASNHQPFPESLIRPPGAREERAFLQRCLQCGVCMRACSTNALQPCGLEGGLEALWTPRVTPKIGYCQFNCNLCGQVCPTEAIQPLPLADKQTTRIGLATFDTARCLPHNYGRECLICEEHCPVSPKAIYLVEKDVMLRDGVVKRIKQPFVDADRCIGCGMCEWSCVFKDRAAIRVTAANESRNSKNQPILPGVGGSYG